MQGSWASVALYTAVAVCLAASSYVPAHSPAWAMPAPAANDVEVTGSITPATSPAAAAPAEASPPPVSLDLATANEVLRELARPRAKPTKAEMCDTLAAAAEEHDLPVGFFVRLIQQESGFNPEVVSSAGAQGVAQFMPKVAEEWGLDDPFDPHQALPASARFLRALHQQFGNWGLAAAAYNGGMGRIQKWLEKRGKLPDETRKYVLNITGHAPEKWASGKLRRVNFTVPQRAPCKDLVVAAAEDTIPLPVPRPRTFETAKEVPGAPASKREKFLVASRTVKVVTPAPLKIASPAPIITESRAAARSASSVKLAATPKAKGPTKLASADDTKGSAKSTKKESKGRVQVADATRPRK